MIDRKDSANQMKAELTLILTNFVFAAVVIACGQADMSNVLNRRLIPPRHEQVHTDNFSRAHFNVTSVPTNPEMTEFITVEQFKRALINLYHKTVPVVTCCLLNYANRKFS